MLKSHSDRIQNLAKVENLKIAAEGEIPPKAASAAASRATVYVPLEGLVDFKAEEARLQKAMAKLEKELNQSRKKLDNKKFVGNAPPRWWKRKKANEPRRKVS